MAKKMGGENGEKREGENVGQNGQTIHKLEKNKIFLIFTLDLIKS